MSKQVTRKPLGIAIGAAVVASLSMAGAANATDADENIFSMEELTSGYLTAGGHETKDEGEGNCGEGNCGDDKKKDEGEGKCGEGKCGGSAI